MKGCLRSLKNSDGHPYLFGSASSYPQLDAIAGSHCDSRLEDWYGIIHKLEGDVLEYRCKHNLHFEQCKVTPNCRGIQPYTFLNDLIKVVQLPDGIEPWRVSTKHRLKFLDELGLNRWIPRKQEVCPRG